VQVSLFQQTQAVLRRSIYWHFMDHTGCPSSQQIIAAIAQCLAWQSDLTTDNVIQALDADGRDRGAYRTQFVF